MADLIEKKVLKIALVSRLFSLLVQSTFNNLITDYDSSEEHCLHEVNITGQSKPENWKSFGDQAILILVGGNAKWDAVYFLDIAQNGYQYEQNMAFFPLLPLLVYCLGVTLKPLQLLFNLNQKSLLMLSATVVNTTTFTLAALGLFRLTKTTFKSHKFAYRAALFFCFNPASVFFSAAYSESLFSMTQFWGMFFLGREPCSFLTAAFLFALGTGSRSNGVISLGFIAYELLHRVLNTKYENSTIAVFLGAIHFLLIQALRLVLFALITVLPFLAFQYYGFTLFCRSTEKQPWCNQYLPLPYSYIQDHYWNVGFLKYFELKQLPNFLLAMPVVVMGVLGISDYLRGQTWIDILFLGLRMPKRSCSPNLFVYVVHLGFLLVFGVTSMHVQVVTRFVASSSPMIYWLAAMWTTPQKKHCKNGTKLYPNLKTNVVYIYFLLYYWLGFVLHCNFYPWT